MGAIIFLMWYASFCCDFEFSCLAPPQLQINKS